MLDSLELIQCIYIYIHMQACDMHIHTNILIIIIIMNYIHSKAGKYN